MRCTAKKTLHVARETGNDIIVQVKGNQPSLLHSLEQIVATSEPIVVDHSRDRARIVAKTDMSRSIPLDRHSTTRSGSRL